MLRWTVLLLILLPLTALAQTLPTAYFSFEHGMQGVAGKRLLPCSIGGKPELVPGKVGQGLKVGPSFGYLDCSCAGVLNATSGTVEMWVKPLDWNSDDKKFHVFFETRGKGVLYLYNYWTNDRLLMLMGPDYVGPLTSAQVPTTFLPGEWHHIAGTWSPDGVQAYCDGKPAGPGPLGGQLPLKVGETFRLGDQPWQFKRTSGSVIDEVRIYDRALSPAHIAAHAAGKMDFSVPLPQDISRLTFDIDSLAGSVTVSVGVGAADVADNRVQARVALVEPGAVVPVGTAPLPVALGKAQTTLPVPLNKPGKYQLAAEVLLDGKPQFVVRRDLTVPTTEWLGNKIGLEDKVLSPWTPVETAGTTLKCWAREYQFGHSLLPTQIVARDQPLLAAPVTMTLIAGGKPVSLTRQQSRLVEARPTAA
jgi:hypothetical protein